MSSKIININMFTPEEASKKWCPHVRNLYLTRDIDTNTHSKEVLSVASYNADRTHNKCISTNCAMWMDAGNNKGCCGLSAAGALLLRERAD